MTRGGLTLKERVLRAGSWALSGFVLTQVIRLGSNIILTRLLFPEAFGLMAVVYVLMTGLVMFSDLGISQSIIQNRRGDDPDFLNTAWTVQILRGVLIWLMALVIAFSLPLAVSMNWVAEGTVYANPSLPWIWAVYSFVAIIQGFESTKVAWAYRNLQVKVLTQIELLGQLAALVVMVTWASLFHNLWALVVGAITTGLVRCFAGHAWLPGTANKIHWEREAAKEILHFGKWVFFLSIIAFLAASSDRIILGAYLTPTQMGLYSVAFLLSGAFTDLFNSMLTKTAYPAICEVVRERPENIAKVYHRLQLIADCFVFGIAGLLFVVGVEVVNLLYDQRYQDAGPILVILSFGLIAARYAVVYQFCLAVSAMRHLFVANAVRLVTTIVAIPVGFGMAGFEGALIAIVLSQFAGWPVALHFKAQHGLIDLKKELVGLPVFVLAAVVGWGCAQILN